MRAAVIVLCVGLAGCAGAPIVRTERVDVPVPVPCRAPDVRPPIWATAELRPDAGIYEKVAALLAELEQRKAYEMRMQAALAACR